MSFTYITHKGKKVLIADYTKCNTSEEMLALLEAVAEEYVRSPVKIRSLSDFTGAFGSNEFMKKAKQLGPLLDPKREKSAVTGITGVKKILLQGYNKFVRIKNVPFRTRAEALDYLVK